MGFIPQISCRNCGNKFPGIFNRCPKCGARRVKQSSRTPATTASVKSGSAANQRANSNTQFQFYFGIGLIVLVIVAVIILISASLNGGGGDGKAKGSKRMDIAGEIVWNHGSAGEAPDSVTVDLMADGQKVDSVEVEPNEDGEWTYTFKKVDRYNKDGEEIEYTLSVSGVGEYNDSTVGTDISMNFIEPVVETPAPPPPTPNVTSISVTFLGSSIEEFTLPMSGPAVDLDASIFPVETVATVEWSSSDESICVVDEDGVVSPVGPGWGSVIAKCGAVAVEVKVFVR